MDVSKKLNTQLHMLHDGVKQEDHAEDLIVQSIVC